MLFLSIVYISSNPHHPYPYPFFLHVVIASNSSPDFHPKSNSPLKTFLSLSRIKESPKYLQTTYFISGWPRFAVEPKISKQLKLYKTYKRDVLLRFVCWACWTLAETHSVYLPNLFNVGHIQRNRHIVLSSAARKLYSNKRNGIHLSGRSKAKLKFRIGGMDEDARAAAPRTQPAHHKSYSIFIFPIYEAMMMNRLAGSQSFIWPNDCYAAARL